MVPDVRVEREGRLDSGAGVAHQRHERVVEQRPPVVARLVEHGVRQHVIKEDVPRHGARPRRGVPRLERVPHTNPQHVLVQARRVRRGLVLLQEGQGLEGLGAPAGGVEEAGDRRLGEGVHDTAAARRGRRQRRAARERAAGASRERVEHHAPGAGSAAQAVPARAVQDAKKVGAQPPFYNKAPVVTK